ncbi:MAG: MEDS domain-containing protein [Armatimonadetes bacterium]|nr:MEDS domain-containing protein [Armatimonadota bacterium]
MEDFEISGNNQLRNTGIEIIGEVPWGAHFCQFYETEQDLTEILVPYFKAGLESNEFCMWVTAEPLHRDEAEAALRWAMPDLDRYLKAGQIEIISYDQWYVLDGSFDQDRVLSGWVEKLERAQKKGYDGLRLTGNTFWLEKDDWNDFTDYEEAVNAVIGNYRMIAICTYSLAKCGASEIADVISNHQFALMRRGGQWSIVEDAQIRRTREELRRSEERYKTLFNEMTEGFAVHEIICDESGQPCDYRFLEVNPAFEKLTGLRKDDVIGRTVRDVLPGIESYWIETFGKVALTGEPAHIENLSQELGKYYSVYAFCPAPGQFACVFLDVTKRRQADMELQRRAEQLADANEELQVQGESLAAINEELQKTNDELAVINQQLGETRTEAERRAAELQAFVSSVADGVSLIDGQGDVVWMNEAGRRILAVPPGEPVQDWMLRSQRFTLDGERLARERRPVHRALRGETVRDFWYKVVTPGEQEIIVSASASPVYDSDGCISGATYVFRDVRERVELERQREQLLQRERRIADMLQQALVPPQLAYNKMGCRIATRYQPALKEAEVGGDFYDIFDLDGGKIGILIGDVAGKGLVAAIRVAAVRHAIRSYAYLDPSPARVLMLANDALSRDEAETGSMLTAIFAVIDMPARVLTCACGGQEPPLLRTARGTTSEIPAGGSPLGIAKGFTYTEERHRLQPGDTIIMVTDGITEARRDSISFFGKEGIIEYLSSAEGLSPDDIASGLLTAAISHARGSLQDDAAIVVFQHDDETTGETEWLTQLSQRRLA